MYLWNTDGLAQELKEGTLSESDKFKYFYILTIIISIAWGSTFYMAEAQFSLSDIIQSILDIIIVIIGTYFCYAINRDGDGKNFIERYICLNFPILIKFVVFLIFGYVILGILFGSSFIVSEGLFEDWFIYTYATLLNIYFYWRIYIHLKWISHENTGIN